jgi:hypothetical protein
VLTFDFAAPVRLMRVRFKNGPAEGHTGDGFVDLAVIETQERRGEDGGVHVRLPARPNLFLFDCDLGTTRWARVTIWRATRTARRNAALRRIEFQGVPPAAAGPAPTTPPARPAADPVALEPDRPLQSYHFNDCRRAAEA